jgi:serine phosphatase RsbU (regulator of sigma subunit)
MDRHTSQGKLTEELENFQQIALALNPSSGSVPRLEGVDIHGLSLPLSDQIGGDHLIYLDFNERYDLARRIQEAESGGRDDIAEHLRECRQRAGILVADVSGHRMTDALIAAMLHQAFLLGTYYELDRFGRITTKLFEHINQRFYRSTNVHKYLTMIYGEVSAEGRFRFLSAGHPPPKVFSREFGRFVDISADRLVSFPPVGMFASNADPDERVSAGALGYKQTYTINEIDLLADGDILLLFTDGLAEHAGGEYFPASVGRLLASSGDQTAKQICGALKADLLASAAPKDDISFVVMKKTRPRNAKRNPQVE